MRTGTRLSIVAAFAWLAAFAAFARVDAPTRPAATARPHALGLAYRVPVRTMRLGVPGAPPALPTEVDLSAGLPPTGDQGPVGSCVSWAEGYYVRGWWAAQVGAYPPGGFAPMYLYSQVARLYDGGQDGGSTLEQPAGILADQGIDTAAHYPFGNYDYADQPTADARALAARYRIESSFAVWTDVPGAGADYRTPLEAELAAGRPVVLALRVFPTFDAASYADPTVGPPPPGAQIRGWHAVAAYGYTAAGVRIRNQWGVAWGHNGDALLTWGYLSAALGQVEGFRVAAPAPAPSPTATAAPLATATTALTPTATVAPAPSRAVPSPTPPALLPWHPAAPALPAGLPRGSYAVTLYLRDPFGHLRAQASLRVRR